MIRSDGDGVAIVYAVLMAMCRANRYRHSQQPCRTIDEYMNAGDRQTDRGLWGRGHLDMNILPTTATSTESASEVARIGRIGSCGVLCTIACTITEDVLRTKCDREPP